MVSRLVRTIGGCGLLCPRMTESTQRPVLHVLDRLNARVTLRDSALNAARSARAASATV